MLIGVVSDTHDNLPTFLQAIELFNKKKVDLVFHLGDWVSPFMPAACKALTCKVYTVDGNNNGDWLATMRMTKDVDIEFCGLTKELDVDGRKCFLFHGHSPQLLNAAISSGEFDAVFSGHNHKAETTMHGKTLHVNPGSTCVGLGHPITVAIYDTEKNEAEIITL